jgi:hypothetical protein
MTIETNIFFIHLKHILFPLEAHGVLFLSNVDRNKWLLRWKQTLFACKQIILSIGSNVDINEYVLHLFYGIIKRPYGKNLQLSSKQ